MNTPDPGIYPDVPFPEYLAWPCVNFSTLKFALRSPAHYQAAVDSPAEPSEAQSFGSLVHAAALEPLAIAKRYVVQPDFHLDEANVTKTGQPTESKSTTYYKQRVAEFRRVNAGKQIVPQGDYDTMVGMVEALRNDSRAMSYFGLKPQTEVSMVWQDTATGLLCKARFDVLNETAEPFVVDLKSCTDAGEFEAAIWRFQYYVQMAYYCDGYAALRHRRPQAVLIALEKSAPFAVRAAPVGLATLEAGRKQYRRALETVARCQAAGVWPGYESPEFWELHDSKLPPVELTQNGKPLCV